MVGIETDARRGLDGDRRLYPPTTQIHSVGLDLTDLRPLCRLLIARMRVRDLDILKAILLGQKRQWPKRLTAIG
jgi:hypothetical protein